MHRIDETFRRLRAQSRKALIPFITAGDPSLEAAVPVMHALVRAGADVIELGVPFSDPMADGPVIQHSSERALQRGVGLAYVLQTVDVFRQSDAVTPVVLMGYLNPLEIYGIARFTQQALASGVDGVLLVDLPPEEADEIRADLFGGWFGTHRFGISDDLCLPSGHVEWGCPGVLVLREFCWRDWR